MIKNAIIKKMKIFIQVFKKGCLFSQLFKKASMRTMLRYCIDYKWTIIVVMFPVALFIKLSKDLIYKELTSFDKGVYVFASRYISDNMTEFMKMLSFLGSGWVLTGITSLIIALLWRNKKYIILGWMIASNLALSSLLNEIVKAFFQRPRPEILRLAEAIGYSFPSGHSMTGMSFYGFLIYLCIRHFKHWLKYCTAVVLGLLVILIGISRIYLGVHYASDVVAGFSAGLVWLAVFITSVNRVYLKIRNRTTDDG